MEIIFSHPEYLWFLLSIPILISVHFLTLKTFKKRAVKFANFEAIRRVTGGELLSKNLFLLFIRILVLLLFVFSLAGFTFVYVGVASNYDYILTIDSSNSMSVEDFQPSRFDAVKTVAKDFINELSADNYVGVVSFSSVSMVETPLSNDFIHVKAVIDSVELSDVGGTDIGQAIVNSVNLLVKGERGKAVILLTDGQSNLGMPLNEAIDYANLREVIVYTIGIATVEGSEFYGAPLTLDEESLAYIAMNTGGQYYKAENIKELEDAYEEISNSVERKIAHDLSLTFILLSLLLLLYEWMLINTRYRTIP